MSSLGRHDSAAPERGSPSDFSRRRFLQVMGASMALASASGCTWDTEEILPFQRRPEGRIPGSTQRFATAIECSGVASALLVSSYDGRPIKIEGNPLRVQEGGACSARSQAAVLDLYDPDLSRGLVQVHEGVPYPRSWKEFDPWFAAELARRRAGGGAGLAILAEPSSSLTQAALRARFMEQFPRTRWVEWEPLARTQELEGARLAFGRGVRTLPRLETARTLACFDADILGEHPDALQLSRAFARRRDPDGGEVLRTWVFESTPSLTGAAADQRLALRCEQILPLVLALELRVLEALAGGGSNSAALLGSGFLKDPEVAATLEALAQELVAQRGRSLLIAGPRQPAAVHALLQRINSRLGNVGSTLLHVQAAVDEARDPAAELAQLVREIEAGAIDALLILGGNPVYDAPADVDLRRALRKLALSAHLGHYRDETSRACTWHLPRAHALESWGDARAWDGTVCTIQPLIDPLYERRSVIELLAGMCAITVSARELVRAAVAGSADEAQWRRILHDGMVPGSAFVAVECTLLDFEVEAPRARQLALEVANAQLELVFAADAKLHDGRSANNAWLQELPDAITKLCWGNAAIFAESTARQLGVEEGMLVRLALGGRELEVAATILPGQAPGSVTLALGYGRSGAGLVGGLAEQDVDPVGYDAYRLRASGALHFAGGLTVTPTDRSVELARTQDAPLIDAIGTQGRDERVGELLRVITLEQLRHTPDGEAHAAAHAAHGSLFAAAPQGEVRWGMSIDLNACIGCNACVIACQAENNVPVVGREQVIRNREMHWIRLDRYFVGEGAAARVRFQPMTCQHCESAPCEQVCPVAATVHSAEGLNEMVYNRCVGTRYCANNCPFKVRRFNFFNYHKQLEQKGRDVQRMLYNPEVTVRSRGVMEKCTFCVQRIQNAKIDAKNAGRKLADGDVTPACAQTCPTHAIVFGDLADEHSRVSRRRADRRAYTMLEELHIRQRTTYMARVDNPHPAAGAHGG